MNQVRMNNLDVFNERKMFSKQFRIFGDTENPLFPNKRTINHPCNWQKVLKSASKAMKRAYECFVYPDFYRQLGQDVTVLQILGAVMRRMAMFHHKKGGAKL